MAVDTAEKRYSAINFGLPWFRTLPEVDGGIEADDRLHLMGLYSGIAAGSGAVAGPFRVVALDIRSAGPVASDVRVPGFVAADIRSAGPVAADIKPS